MYKQLFSLLIILSCFLLIHFSGFSQDLGNSPYSRAGIGDINQGGFAIQEGMGSSGVSYSIPFFINPLNPALLSRNRNTIFEAGVVGQLRNLKEGDRSQRDFGGSIDYLSLAFPVSRRMTMAIGLEPYSSVSYENTFLQEVNNSDFLADVTYRGSGGFSRLYLAQGIELLNARSLSRDTLKHRLSLGVRANYMFGAIVDEVISEIRSANAFQVAFKERTSVADFTLELGLAYSLRLPKDYRLNFGANYSLASNLNAKRFTSVDRRNDDFTFDGDTLLDNQRGEVRLPERWAVGISLDQNLKWAISADVYWQNWQDYQEFQVSDTLSQSMGVAIGGQYIPDFSSVRKGFWRRTIYRAGLNYQRTPSTIQGQDIEDISVSLGAAIPFGRSRTSLNLALIAGQRGRAIEGLIRDNYYRFHLGITINDTWFIKRKYD